MKAGTTRLFSNLAAYLEGLRAGIESISAERREILEPLGGYVHERVAIGAPARVVFICTHNSRRSQLAQVWAQAAACVFGIEQFSAYSGGTEITACNPRTVAALRRAGFRIESGGSAANPRYAVFFGEGFEPAECFSKLYHDPPNPEREFCAVMTCSNADAGCPVVLGAEERLPIRYEDPKISDGTDREAMMYDERCRQIGAEMFFVFDRVTRLGR